MDQSGQIRSVIVKINMDGTENHPRFVVEEVKAQSGPCFEGAENLLRARFECLCCKTGYVVLPLITKTKPTWMQMEVSIAENFPTAIQETVSVEPATEGETGSSLDMAHDSDVEPKQGDEFVDSKAEADQGLRQDSIDIGPLEHQSQVGQMTDLEKEVFGRTRTECSLEEVDDSDEEQKQGDGDEDSEAETKTTSSMDVDPDSVETQSREIDAPVVPVETQGQNIEGSFYTCDICTASIKYRRHLPTHMKTHMGIRYTCSKCPKSFSYKSHLNKHKKNLHQSEFRICEVCNRSKTCTKAEYYSHLRRRHPEFHKKELQPKVENFNGVDFPCIYCEPQATFKSFEELKEHFRVTHDRNFACTQCPIAWNQSKSLKNHIESVHEKKTFSCQKCDKVFTWKKNLNQHLHSHK